MGSWSKLALAGLVLLDGACVYMPYDWLAPEPVPPLYRRHPRAWADGWDPGPPRGRHTLEAPAEPPRTPPGERAPVAPPSVERAPAPLPQTPTSQSDESPSGPTGAPPVATPGSRPGRVKSPFPPYRELDVSGMASGSLARDPVSGKVFRLP